MPVTETVERIFALVDKKFIEQKEFAAAMGTTPSIISQWRNGVSKSYERRLSKIADVLDTTVEYLETGVQKEKPALPKESELDEELVRRLMQLTPEERKQVDAFLQGLLSSR